VSYSIWSYDMTNHEMTNQEYLKFYLTKSEELPDRILLPHERLAVENAINKQREAFEVVIEQKIEVTGGDDWHDGAFRATDNEAKIIGQQMSAISLYIGATAIGYPNLDETRVTLGSRVAINQDGFLFPIDIVGFRAGYPSNVMSDEYDDEVTGVSPDSPLAQLIMGQEVGFKGTFTNHYQDLAVEVQTIDQRAVMDYFTKETHEIQITD